MKSALVTSLAMHAGLVGGLAYCLGNGGESSANMVLDAFENAPTSIQIVWASSVKEGKASLKKSNDKLMSTVQHQKQMNETGSGGAIHPEPLSFKQIPSLSPSKEGENHGKPFIPHPANQMPAYPEEAREIGLEGDGLVRLYLTKTGAVLRIEKCDSLSDVLFHAAQKTLRTWRFTGNLPEYVDVPVEFRLGV